MSNKLAGKVCVITGTAGSIGTAATLAFAREGALVIGTGQEAGSSDEAVTVRLALAAGPSASAAWIPR
jgi:NAD(P)-dependent dehydrogenase (short-subunit alcohol dehydrogenase family)